MGAKEGRGFAVVALDRIVIANLRDVATRLSTVQVKAFKAIKDSGKVALRPLTLLIGRNGSGKSSLVEALQLLQEALEYGLQRAVQERYHSFDELLNRRAAYTRTISLALELAHGSVPVRYELEFRQSGTHKENCRQGRTNATREAIWTRSSVRHILRGPPIRDPDSLALAYVTKTGATGAKALLDFIRGAVFLRLSPTILARSEPLTRSTRAPTLDETGAGVVALLRALTPTQRERVAQKIASVVGGVEDILVLQDATRGYYATEERMKARGGARKFPVPAWMLSEGTRRLTALYALLARSPRPSLLVIEEIENGLDPWTLQSLFHDLREAAEEGVQVIVTTHSPFLLDHVGDIDDILHAQREAGETTYTPIANYDEVVRYKGVVMPGAMYASDYFKP